MREERLEKILSSMFKQFPVDELARERLRRELFESAALSDDDLWYVAAAGDAHVQSQPSNLFKENEKDENNL